MLKKVEYHTVPWYDAAEWHKVNKLTYGPSSDIESKREALQMLLVWRSRSSELPAPIDCTLSLLEVDLHEYQKLKNDETTSDHALRLLYSAAMIRFINLMLDESDKRITLLQAAALHRLPRWIVNLRHEAAHGRDLPSLPSLKQATTIALNWLYTVYWLPQSSILTDFHTTKYTISHKVSKFEEKMSTFISVYNTISVLNSSYFNIQLIGNIKDVNIKKDLLAELQEIGFSTKMFIGDETNLKFAQKEILQLMTTFFMKSSYKNKKESSIDLLMEENSFFMCTDIISMDEESNLNDYMKAWKGLLNLFYDNDMIMLLVNKILNLVQSEKYSDKVRNLGAMWINYIAFSLQKTSFISQHLISQGVSKNTLKRGHIPAIIEKCPKFHQGMLFNVWKPIPTEICSVSFFKEAIYTYHPFLHKYAENLINLVQPPISNKIQNSLLKLMNITNTDHHKLNDVDQNYSIKSVMDVMNPNAEIIVEDEESVSDDDILMESPWEVVSGDYNWGECPIGLLPWQVSNAEVSFQLS